MDPEKSIRQDEQQKRKFFKRIIENFPMIFQVV